MKKRYPFLFIIIFFLTFSCKKIEPPAYLFIEEQDLKINTDNFRQIYDDEKIAILKQHDFREVFISLNGKELGFWHLPCSIPLMPDYSKENNIRITPCTRVPNVTLNTVQYTFLLSEERFFTLDKKGVYRLSDLNFEYAPSVSFPILETFSQYTEFKPRDTVYFTAPMEIYKAGNTSMGRIALTDSLDFFNVVSDTVILFGQGVQQYWEMEYKCENGEITTYLDFQNSLVIMPQQDMIVLPATTSWKKIYIDLTDVVSWAAGTSQRISFRLGMRGLKNSDTDKAYFYFRYVKLITMLAPY